MLTILVKQNVVRFDVSVQNHLSMHDVNSSEHLLHHELNFLQSYALLLLHEELSKSRVAILKDAVYDLVFVALILDYVKNFDEVGFITETLKDRDFSHR